MNLGDGSATQLTYISVKLRTVRSKEIKGTIIVYSEEELLKLLNRIKHRPTHYRNITQVGENVLHWYPAGNLHNIQNKEESFVTIRQFCRLLLAMAIPQLHSSVTLQM
jgi:hypothetical protein